MMPFALVVESSDDSSRIVLDPQFPAGTEALVTVEGLTFFCDLYRNLDASCGDVSLEGLELLGWEIREDLIGRAVVAVDLHD